MLELFAEGVIFWGGLFLALLTVLYIAGTWNFGEMKRRGMVYENPLPFVGNNGSFMTGAKAQGEISMELYKKYKGHRAFGFYNFSQPTVVIRDPELVRIIAVKDFDYFTDHIPFFEETDDKLFGKALINLRGARWRAMRTTLSPAFTSSKMKAMYSLVDKCGEQLAEYLQKKCKEEKSGLYRLEMRDLFTKFTNDVIATSAYGLQCDSLNEPDNEFYKTGLEITHFGGLRMLILIAYITVPKIMRSLPFRITDLRLENFFCSLISNTMKTREKENIIRPDMIHLLMEARKGTLRGDEGEESGGKKLLELSDDDIAAQAFIFFFAGFDTSSTLLSFLSYQLAINPEVQEKVQLEIDEVLAANDGVLSYDAVQKMKYLDTVISETLRMWPPIVDIDRGCIRDYVIPATESAPAVVIKKGDGVQLPVYGIHHDPEYWPEPERFDPDRFNEENKHTIKPFTYMPFGTGPRACIGNRFALMEVKIAMANVLSKVTFVVTEKTPIPIQLKRGTFNVQPEGGMWLGVKPRA